MSARQLISELDLEQMLGYGTFVTDEQWNLLDWSKGFAGLLGLGQDENLKNRNIFQILGLDASILEESGEKQCNITFTYPVTGFSYYLSIQIITREDNKYGAGFLSKQVNPGYDAIWCNHIHYRMLKYQQIHQLEKRLEGLIHNVNTPLNTIIGYVQILLRESPESKALQKIMESGFQIDSSLKCILDRMESSRTQFRNKVSVNDLIRNEIDLARNDLFFKHNVKTELELEETLPQVLMVPSDLSYCIDALLWNAVESFQDQDTKQILISTTRDGKGIRIMIRDNGSGIQPKDLPLIFQVGFSTKSRDHYQHLGLGLSFSRQIIEDCGGKLSVESAYKTGTTVTIDLPVEELS